MIEPRYNVLQSLFADRVFRIPHYQRFYSWKTRQRNDLFNDLLELKDRTDDQHHFMATVVCHRTTETKDVGAAQYRVYDIVDGQQRLTTLILLLKSIELALPDSSDDRTELAKILVKRDGQLILLQTNNVNELNFNGFIRHGAMPGESTIKTHSDKNLAAAIRECRDFVQSWQQEHKQELLALMRLLLHRLGFVVYDTQDARVVYTIFEVLNSRGLAVDWLDKTKSVLMGRMYELSESQEVAGAEIQHLQNIWGKVYNEIAKEDVPGEEILRVTATLYYGPGQGKPRSAEDSLDFLKKECTSFDSPSVMSKRLHDVAVKLVGMYASRDLGPVVLILQARLLAVAIKSAAGVNEDEMNKILEQWERVTFRIFGLFDKDARTKVGDYVRLAHQIVTADIETRTYNQIMGKLRDLGREYKIEQAVKEGLSGTNLYDHPEKCRYILWAYEEHLGQKLGGHATIDEEEKRKILSRRASESIEHICPQNAVGSEWERKSPEIRAHVNRIGNLLLLPVRLNQEAQNLPFTRKKEVYRKHNLRMIGEICEQSEWSLSEIEAREERIVAWARTRWCDV